MNAKGTFEVQMNAVEQTEHGDGAMRGRWSLDKQFSGDLVGTGLGEVLTVGTKSGSAAYVAIEEIKGVLLGRAGSFFFQHSATMHQDQQSLTITVVPDSGTAALSGISGSFLITIVDGIHFYEFEYSIGDEV